MQSYIWKINTEKTSKHGLNHFLTCQYFDSISRFPPILVDDTHQESNPSATSLEL